MEQNINFNSSSCFAHFYYFLFLSTKIEKKWRMENESFVKNPFLEFILDNLVFFIGIVKFIVKSLIIESISRILVMLSS